MAFDKQLVKVFIAMCDEVDSPLSRELRKLAIDGKWKELVTVTIRPQDYLTAHQYFGDASCVAFFRKNPADIGIDRKARALESFWSGEAACCASNLTFTRFLNNACLHADEMPVLDTLSRAKAYLEKVLGRLPDDLDLKFGPGSTYLDRGKRTLIPDKIENIPLCTPGARALLPFWEKTAWARRRTSIRDPYLQFVKGNRFTTVPKDCRTDRGICVEPSINISLQLAVGSVLKDRLLSAGINLKRENGRVSNAQVIHRDWARRASLDGEHATLDLSSASDTISKRLVEFLLPPRWFELLNSLRSTHTLISGKWVYLEKFSSMGNGFTFELETLIFASLCHAVCGGGLGSEFSVFGDDIIIPTDCVVPLLSLLETCGFKVNSEKSFSSGPFRESCGGDFYRGIAVRPYYVTVVPSSPEDWISIVNGLERSNRLEGGRFCSRFEKARKRSLDNIPNQIRRLKGPPELGDLCVTDDSYQTKTVRGVRYVRGYAPVATSTPWHHWPSDVIFSSILYFAGSGTPELSRGLLGRDSVTSYKMKWIPFS